MIKVVVVPHTHWDREWYETAARFRQRLVRMLDEVIAVLERDPAFSCFLLDGQTAIIDDYLAIRPEQRDRLAALAASGRLLVGPWYVLSDELLSSDESLVRNLLTGRRVAESVGPSLALGYSPDAFGHPAALPTVFAGFGIRHGILWRGYGGEPGQERDLFRWVAPDGSALVVHHLPPPGYEIGSGLPHDSVRLALRWKELAAMLSPRATSGLRLIPAGADHHAIEPRLPALLDELRRAAPDHEFSIASPLEYFAGIGDSDSLSEARGELRFSYRYTWTLQGIHSTRARLKAAIAEGDRLLLRWAEPQAALALVEGREDARALLAAAWRDHLLNHPHDSFGGCVTDEVARDIAARASSVVIQGRGLLVDLLHERLQQDRSAARRGRARWTPSLVLVNPRPVPSRGVVEATVTVFQDDIVVGSPDRRSHQSRRGPIPGLATADGAPVAMQILDQYDAFERLDSPRDYPDEDRVRAFRVALLAPEVPALGLRTLKVTAAAGTGESVERPVNASAGEVKADSWTVSARGSRAFALEAAQAEAGPEESVRASATRPSTLTIRAVADLVSDQDQGDTYTFQPVAGDEPLVAQWSEARVVWPGPLVAAIARDFTIPDRVQGTVTIRADQGSDLIRVAVDGMNLAGNHRLRIRFPLPKGARAGMAVADMQYGPVTRKRQSFDLREFNREWPVSTAPMHRYVSAGRPGNGLTVFTRGLYEYELTPDGAVAITIFRGVGELSRGDLAARAGNAAWPMPTPEAQELGRFRAELAILLSAVNESSTAEEWAELERHAEAFHAPVAGMMLRYGIDVPQLTTGPQLSGNGLAFKALKPAEKGDGVVVRCVNLTGETVSGRWTWPAPLARAQLARLDETPFEEIALENGGTEIPFTVPPRAVMTILATPAR